MIDSPPLTLVDPQTGNLAFKIFSFEDADRFDQVQRLNYYSILLITHGSGNLKADFSEYSFAAHALLCFSPYQPFLITNGKEVQGMVIHFHPDFFCIHKHHHEVACHGILFNTVYEPPFHSLDPSDSKKLIDVIDQMKDGMKQEGLAQYELLVSYLKIFLIHATRTKLQTLDQANTSHKKEQNPFQLQKLKDFIELHYKEKRSPGHYADLLNMTPKALAKLTKHHFNKTLTDLITERVVIEAKRELYLTSKPVKEIARDLGFNDEFYFSRFFKTNADVSPQLYRQTVGYSRGEA
jgi:AraC-like DNA-binding protein